PQARFVLEDMASVQFAPSTFDAGQICSSLFEGAKERLPRCGGNCRGRAAADDEICGDQDFRTARLAGAAPGARAIGQSTHWHHQSNPRLFAGARDRRAPISTGDRTILGKISKRGNRYLRVLFVQATWVVLVKPKIWERHGLKPWIE